MSTPTQIGDFLHRIKRPIELEPDDKYKLVTVKLKHNGVVLRQEKFGAEIKSKMYKVKVGDFILSGIDARNGAFGIVPPELDGAIVTNDFWYFDIDEEIVDKRFFLELTSTKWFDEICRKGSDGTTQRIRLQKDKFFNQTVSLPPLEQQRDFITRFERIKTNHSELSSELIHQQTLIKKIRLQILQEAIEGKLTADWRAENPDVEPASELVARIIAEKHDLIKAKKIKKQKSLPSISDTKVPFELPEKWAWCRLNELFLFIDYRGKTPNKLESGIRLITAKNVKAGKLSLHPEDYISENEYIERMTRGYPKYGDLLFTTEAPLGNVCLLNIKDEKISTGQRLITLQSYVKELPNMLFMFFMLSPFFQESLLNNATGVTAKGIKASRLKEILLPMPSALEQQVIVTKIEKLFSLCDRLESQISQNQTHADALMQAVLGEAFTSAPNTEQITNRKLQDNVVSLKPNRVDYYKRTLLAAEIVNQLHNEPTLGHLKLQKLIFLCQKTQDMQLPTNFLQQAAGPYDPKMARSLDKQLRDRKWFEFRKNELHKYQPLYDAGTHKNDFEKYFADDLSAISRIIKLFRRARSEEMEAVATLYACWEKAIDTGNVVTSDLLIHDFYQWSDEKRKFPEGQLKKYVDWMIDHNIQPSA